MFVRILLQPRSPVATSFAYNSRVRKYHDIFKNIKISKISKMSWYFWYISDIFDIFKSELVTRVGLKLLNHAKISKCSL